MNGKRWWKVEKKEASYFPPISRVKVTELQVNRQKSFFNNSGKSYFRNLLYYNFSWRLNFCSIGYTGVVLGNMNLKTLIKKSNKKEKYISCKTFSGF